MPTPNDRDDDKLTDDQDPKEPETDLDDDELDIDDVDLDDYSDDDADSTDTDEDDDSDESGKRKPKPAGENAPSKDWESIAKTALAQRDHWKRKAQKSQTSPEPSAPQGKQQKKQQTNATIDSFALERFEFRQDFPHLKRSEVEEVEAYARGKGISLYDAVSSPFVKHFLRVAQKKREVAGASVDSSHRTKPSRVMKSPDEMSLEELEKYTARRVQESRRKAGL